MTPDEIQELKSLMKDLFSLVKENSSLIKESNDLLTVSSELTKTLLSRFTWISSLLASSTNRQIVLIDRLEKSTTTGDKLTEAILGFRQKAADLYDQNEERRGEINLGLRGIDEKLAVLSKDVDDVERATREATGTHRIKKTPVAVSVLNTIIKVPTSGKIWLLVIAMSVLAVLVVGLILRQTLGQQR